MRVDLPLLPAQPAEEAEAVQRPTGGGHRLDPVLTGGARRDQTGVLGVRTGTDA